MLKRYEAFWTWLVTTIVYTAIHPFGLLPDPDALYHAFMARGFVEGFALANTRMWLGLTLPTSFPWLPLTTLARDFADQHLLYHVALAPFVAVFGASLGASLSAIAFAGVFALAMYYALRSLRVPAPWLWTLLTLLNPWILFRFSVPKASSLAVGCFVVGVAACVQALEGSRRGYTLLAVAMSVFFLTHGGWLTLVLASGVLASVHGVTSWRLRAQTLGDSVRRGCAAAGAVLLGLVAGWCAHPYRMELLAFLRTQLFQVFQAHPTIRVGLEWSPTDLITVFANQAPLMIALLLFPAVYVMARGAQLERSRIARAAALVAVWLVFTATAFKHQRMMEYAIPALGVAVGAVWSLAPGAMSNLWLRMQQQLGRKVYILMALFAGLIGRDAGLALVNLRWTTRTSTRIEPVAAYLREHTQPGDVIYHQRWDLFPELVLALPDRRYTWGMDPTFLWREHPELATSLDMNTVSLQDIREKIGANAIVELGAAKYCTAPAFEANDLRVCFIHERDGELSTEEH